MNLGERTLKARLPNGIVVSVRSATPSRTSDLERLAWLLDSSDTREVDLLRFLVTVAPAIFPDADPSRRPEISSGPTDRGFDLMFPLLRTDSVGIVEIKSTRGALQSGGTSRAIEQVKWAIENGAKEHQVRVAYVIAGRRGPISQIEQQQYRNGQSVPIYVWSWEDVVLRLSGEDQDAPEPAYEVVWIEMVQLSRRLLRQLLLRPKILAGIDDRKFEELVATLLFDLGLQDVQLTPARQDGGRDIIATHYDRRTGKHSVFLIECKHWVSGNKVTLRWALSLLDVAKREGATGSVLLSSSGFGPRLLEQETELAKEGLLLRDQGDLQRWLKAWERQYGSVLLQPVDPQLILSRVESSEA